MRQRGPYDCTVAALAMATRKSYDEVDRAYQAAGVEVPAYMSGVRDAAAVLGFRVVAAGELPWPGEGLLLLGSCLPGVDGHMV